MITLFAGAAIADAAPLTVGDDIHVLNGPGDTGGGEFTIVVDPTTSFVTFCLQMTEYINFTSAFNVDAISTFAISDSVANGGDASGKDYLSAQTAFLYTEFRQGTLSGYSYSGPNHVTSANNLQYAIWMFEQELPTIASNPFVMLANSAVSSGTWSGIGNVRVMNLSWTNPSRNHEEAQDQLMLVPGRDITEVPEPASLILFGSGVSLAAMARRRQRRSAKNT
jgi:PEP-CTERM motif